MSSSGADKIEAAVLEGGARCFRQGEEVTPTNHSLIYAKIDAAPGVEDNFHILQFWRLSTELKNLKRQYGRGGQRATGEEGR